MKIYLISPYSHKDPSERERRFIEAAKVVGELVRLGHVVYSPIVSCHPVAVHCKLDGDVETWWDLNKAFMRWAEIGVIVALAGWSSSVGIRAEVDYMINNLKKPVLTLEVFLHTLDPKGRKENGREEV